jgi:hypothetical protein
MIAHDVLTLAGIEDVSGQLDAAVPRDFSYIDVFGT